MIRVGNAAYMRATTTVSASLRCATSMSRSPARHCVLLSRESQASNGELKLADRRIARVVRGAQDLPGQHLFQYVDENGDAAPD